jgi:hypothetical protein
MLQALHGDAGRECMLIFGARFLHRARERDTGEPAFAWQRSTRSHGSAASTATRGRRRHSGIAA